MRTQLQVKFAQIAKGRVGHFGYQKVGAKDGKAKSKCVVELNEEAWALNEQATETRIANQ